MKLKILYTITQGHWGGAQKYVTDLALHLSQNANYEITVACGEQSEGLFAVLQNSPVKTIKLRHLARAINPLKDVLALGEIIGILKTGQFDIVHANSSKAGFLTAMAHGWLRSTQKSTYRARLVYTAHGWVFTEPLAWYKKFIYLFMEQIAARMREATIVLSQKEKIIALRTLGARKELVHVIPNGIDCAQMNFFDQQTAREQIQKFIEQTNLNRQEYSISQLRHVSYVAQGNTLASSNPLKNTQHIWIGTIANLYKTKGIDMLIRAASFLRERNNATKTNGEGKRATSDLRAQNAILPYFFVIGKGPERAQLQTLIQKFNLADSFFLVGTLPDAAQYLKAFDLFVLPSLKEGFPYTLLEASCAGVPIIASDVGAIPEIIRDEENGLIVPHGDSAELAHAITQTLMNTKLYAQIKTSARQIADTYSLEKTIEETKNVYLELKKDG